MLEELDKTLLVDIGIEKITQDMTNQAIVFLQ